MGTTGNDSVRVQGAGRAEGTVNPDAGDTVACGQGDADTVVFLVGIDNLTFPASIRISPQDCELLKSRE